MNVKLPNDQTRWFRNLPPKASDEGSEEVQESAEKAPEVELWCCQNKTALPKIYAAFSYPAMPNPVSFR